MRAARSIDAPVTAPRLRLLEIDLFERRMDFTHPFRFGTVTVRWAPQAFVRVTAEVEGRTIATGATAEMMMPKWFDKRPHLTPEETIDELRQSLVAARGHYLSSSGFDTAFGHHERGYRACTGDGDLPQLVAAFGPAVIDKAVLDALFVACEINTLDGLRKNLPGIGAGLTPDVDDASIRSFLAALAPNDRIALRWTVGMLDDLGDLERRIAATGLKFLKVKVGGDAAADLGRLRAIAGILERAEDVRVTLDANEQYDSGRLRVLCDALGRDAALAPLWRRLLYIEQPLARDDTLSIALGGIADDVAFVIDEADGSYDAFPRAVEAGYRGVSSKSCKGLYKALLNAVRAESLNRTAGAPGRYFVTAEDLTCQAGLAVQQDTALAALLGVEHVERNGHHYVDGFRGAPAAEAQAFLAAHPDLYAENGNTVVLETRRGALAIGSLFTTHGFASGAEPDWPSLSPLSITSAPEGVSS
ncbi:MAG: enolase [Rhizobiaceae bacterium]|nr:MAG: enolase [Rhizobiaceae bacterium]